MVMFGIIQRLYWGYMGVIFSYAALLRGRSPDACISLTALYEPWSHSLNSCITLKKPYTTPLYDPIYNPLLRSLDYSSYNHNPVFSGFHFILIFFPFDSPLLGYSIVILEVRSE